MSYSAFFVCCPTPSSSCLMLEVLGFSKGSDGIGVPGSLSSTRFQYSYEILGCTICDLPLQVQVQLGFIQLRKRIVELTFWKSLFSLLILSLWSFLGFLGAMFLRHTQIRLVKP